MTIAQTLQNASNVLWQPTADRLDTDSFFAARKAGGRLPQKRKELAKRHNFLT
jgi:hypothetical protein